MLLKAMLIWPLLSIVIVTVLCRLIHKAKLADQALERYASQRNAAQGHFDDLFQSVPVTVAVEDKDRRAA
ncbi:hypothetical protein ACQKP5_18360 [Pseudomonas vancouverensis]|uniref:hypothetical protein n=1 Tax=Pseudomonas vancouverensis TaxID=95300 RepID=UPI003D0714C5